MSYEENKTSPEEISITHRFFEEVKNSNLKEIKRIFLDESIRPWEFKEEDEYTGTTL